MSYIEPCCAERQLPQLLRESKGMAFFQTSGDVTVDKMMRAVGCMVGQPCEMWFVAHEVSVEILRMIRYWLQRGWLNGVRIMTQVDCGEMVDAELCAADGLQETVTYAHDEMMRGGMLAFDDGKTAVVIQGEILMSTDFGQAFYAACFGRTEGGLVRGAMDVVKARMRAKVRERAAARPQHTGQGAEKEETAEKEGTAGQEGTAEQATASEKKKRTKRKEGKKESAQ